MESCGNYPGLSVTEKSVQKTLSIYSPDFIRHFRGMGSNVPCSHDAYSLLAILRDPDMQAALSQEGDSSSRNYPARLLLLLAFCRPFCLWHGSDEQTSKATKFALNIVRVTSWAKCRLRRPIALPDCFVAVVRKARQSTSHVMSAIWERVHRKGFFTNEHDSRT